MVPAERTTSIPMAIRLLMVKLDVTTADGGVGAPTQIVVVQNWLAEHEPRGR